MHAPCRFGQEAFLLGFGTDHGTVAAARDWDAPMQVMAVRPSHAASYERLFVSVGSTLSDGTVEAELEIKTYDPEVLARFPEEDPGPTTNRQVA